MFKTFIAGILLGVAAAAAALYFVSPVDQYREQSLIMVHPNQGNTEVFHVNVPMDRIMIGAPAQKNPVPAGLEWPDDEVLADTRAELFKIRNGKDAVVGVASRIAATNDISGDIVEWVLHLPARGSVYGILQVEPTEGGFRVGELRTGTGEFAPLRGPLTERWIADTSGDEDAPAGRIEITTAFVGKGDAE